jgi:hypothetical protein
MGRKSMTFGKTHTLGVIRASSESAGALDGHHLLTPAQLEPFARGPVEAQVARLRRPPSHRQGTRRRILDRIEHPGVKLAIWQRELPDGLSRALLDWAGRESATFEGQTRAEARDLEPSLAGVHAGRWREWLLEDLVSVAKDFVRLAGVKSCSIRFGAVRGDQCRKFHTDRVRLRLITTYAGPGVRRAALVQPAACPDLANREIVKHTRVVRHARAGDVLLMKGAMGGGTGVVHRSPPIEQHGLLRVVLVMST